MAGYILYNLCVVIHHSNTDQFHDDMNDINGNTNRYQNVYMNGIRGVAKRQRRQRLLQLIS